MSAPHTLTATEIARQIDSGTLTAEAVIRSHLERIDKRDKDVLAWSHLARDAALEKAKVLDRGPRKGLLGIQTYRGDRLFISLLGSAFIHLAWIALLPWPLWAALPVSVVYAVLVFSFI